jgi:hypothetical protein
MTWGSGAWGTSSFGGISANPIAVEYAYAISTNELVVVLTKPPLDRSGFLTGDVRNTSSWEVSVPATGALLNVFGVAQYNGDLQWLVRTKEKFALSTGTMRVTIVGLKDAGGSLAGLPDSADFEGVTEVNTATPTALAAFRRSGGRDLANVSSQTISDTNVSGTFVMKGGDYALMEGEALLKKLMIRRLITTPGEFFHLPKYGAGLKVKQPIPAGDLVKLKANIERQLMRERDVASVVVGLQQSTNTLIVQARATLAKSGQKVNVAINSSIGQGG